MISLDMRTIVFSHMITDAVCLLVILLLWRQNHKRFSGIGFWVLNFALQMGAAFLISVPGMPGWITFVLADILVIGGTLLGYIGLVHFVEQRISQLQNFALLAVFAFGQTYFTLVQPNPEARNLNEALALLLISLQCTWFLLFRVEPGMRWLTRGVAVIFGGYSLISVVSLAGSFLVVATGKESFQSNTFETLILISHQVLFILLTYSLVLMVNERLLMTVNAQEEKFNKAFHSSPYAVMLTRLSDGKLIEVNEAFSRITGYRYAEAVGKTSIDLHLWDQESNRLGIVDELLKVSRVQGREFSFCKKSGEKLIGLLSAEIILIDNQKFILSSVDDITERKQIEAALRVNEQRTREILESISDGFWSVDSEWRFTYINQRAANNLGLQPTDLLGRNLWDMFPSMRDTAHEQYYRQVMTERSPCHFEIAGVLTEATYSMSVYPSGEGISVYWQDTTERRQKEEALQASEERLRRMIETSPIAIGFGDSTGKIFEANDSFYRLIGYSREEIEASQLGWDQLTAQEYVELDRQALAALTTTGSARPYEKEFIRKDGSRVPLLLSASKLSGRDEYIAFMIDITERKRTEVALKKAYDELEIRVAERTVELTKMTETLRAERQRFKNALDQLPAYMILLSPEYRVPLANRFFEERFGKSEGRHCYEYLFQRTEPCEVCKPYDVLRDNSAHHWEWTGPDGRNYDIHDFPFTDVDGSPLIMEVGLDITEQKKAQAELTVHRERLEELVRERTARLETANQELQSARLAALNLMEDALHAQEEVKQINTRLRESEQRLSRAQELAHLGSWELDLVNDRLTWSDEVYRIFGLQPQQFAANYEDFLAALHPDDRSAVDAAYSNSIREGRDSYEIEHRIIKHSSGEIRSVHEKCEHFRDETGKIIRSVGMVHDITERKRAEEALRLSEEKFRSAFAHASIGFAMTLPDGSFLDANPAYCELTGFDIEELQRMKSPSLIHTEDHAENMKLIHQLLTGELADFVIENRYLRKDREAVWVRKSVSLVRNVENAPQWIIALVEDITERKQIEEALRRREALLSQTGQMARVGGWELDPQTMTLLWSRETYRIHELDFSLQPSVENAINFYAPEVQPVISGAVARAIKEGQPYDLELPFITATGRHLWIRTMGQAEFQDDKCVRLFGAFQDITERKQAEDALRKAHDELELRVQERTQELVKEIAERKEIEKQLRIRTTAMEAAANGIVITNPDGTIQWANPALRQITGYDGSELVGQSMRIFNSGVHDTDYYRRMWSIILSGQVWRGEVTNRRKDGSLYMEEQTITPVRDENDQVQQFIAIKQDITERKRSEAELAERNIKLQALSTAEREQRQLSESLAEAALVLNKSMKLDEVLPLILEQVKVVIPYQLAIVMMFDGESFYDASHAGDTRWSRDLAQTSNRFPIEDFPLLKKMRQSHQPVMIADTHQETNWMIVHGLEWGRSILCVPLLAENQVIGFLNLLAEQPDFFTTEMRDQLVVFASHASVAIQNAWLFDQVRASNERLQSLSRRLVEIQENERLYIARELHDEAGQMLTALMLDLVTLESQADQPEAVLKKTAEMEEALNAISENLHNVAMALRPASLDHLGLVPALRQYLESVGERYRIKVNFLSTDFQERLPANVETELYRIVQEALTNVVRHAHASQADVVIRVRDHKLIVIVEDDGNGFNPEKIPETGHLGLFGMRERAEMIGGQLVIESKPGKGTTVIVEVDYDSPIVDRG